MQNNETTTEVSNHGRGYSADQLTQVYSERAQRKLEASNPDMVPKLAELLLKRHALDDEIQKAESRIRNAVSNQEAELVIGKARADAATVHKGEKLVAQGMPGVKRPEPEEPKAPEGPEGPPMPPAARSTKRRGADAS